MKNLLYILAFMMVGCSSNNLVKECEGNYRGSSIAIKNKCDNFLKAMKMELKITPRLESYYIQALSIDSIMSDSIAKQTDGIKSTFLAYRKLTLMDSIIRAYSRNNSFCNFGDFDPIMVEYEYPYVYGYLKKISNSDSVVFAINQPEIYHLIGYEDNAIQHKELTYRKYYANYVKEFVMRIDKPKNKHFLINYPLITEEGTKEYIKTIDLNDYAK